MAKKFLIVALTLITLAAATVFAGGRQERGAAEEEGGVIRLWTTHSHPNIRATFKRLYEEFKVANAYDVQETYIPDDQVAMKWAAAAGSGKLPDILLTTPHSLVTWGVTGQLEYLDDVVDDLEGWYSAVIDTVAYDGHHYAVPWHASVVFLYYRTDLLSERGLTAPKNWNQLESAAVKLTSDGVYGLPVPVSTGLASSYIGYMYMRANDGSVYDDNGKIGFDTPNNVETLEFIRRLYRNASNPASSGYSFGDYKNAFWSGSAALFVYYGSLYPDMHKYAPDLENKTGFTKMPVNERLGYVPDKYTVHQSYALSVPKDSRKKEGAKKLIRFVLQSKNNIDLLNSDPADCLPPRAPLAEDPYYWENPIVSKFKEAIQFELKEIPHSSELFLAKGKHPYGTAIFHSLALSAAINRVALTDDPVKEIVSDLHKKYKEIADE